MTGVVVPGQIYHPRAELAELNVSAAELEAWLQWAGSKLLSLPDRNRPQSYRVSWPAIAPEPAASLQFRASALRPLHPSADALALCDKLCKLVTSIDDLMLRRIVFAATLTTPTTRRRLYSWTDIGRLLSLDRKTIRRHFASALAEILRKSNRDHLLMLRRDFLAASASD